jgi:histidine kinase
MEGLIDGVLPADAETYQHVYREADRLQRLVRDLQELSRVEANSFDLNRAQIQLGDLIRQTSIRLSPQFEEKGVDLTVEIEPDLPVVYADEDRVSQVLLNLMGNALQYTPAGGVVSISAQRYDGTVRVCIKDTGIGITAEHLPHLFDRFYRVDKSRSRAGGGSGIGLTISRHLVEAHRGRIWAASDGPGQGSTFSFALPVIRPDDKNSSGRHS